MTPYQMPLINRLTKKTNGPIVQGVDTVNVVGVGSHDVRRNGETRINEAKPADLPVEQATHFEFAINLKPPKQSCHLDHLHPASRRRGDRIRTVFAALHESAHGPFSPRATSKHDGSFRGMSGHRTNTQSGY